MRGVGCAAISFELVAPTLDGFAARVREYVDGWKFGAWHDVGWFHRNLRAGPPPLG